MGVEDICLNMMICLKNVFKICIMSVYVYINMHTYTYTQEE